MVVTNDCEPLNCVAPPGDKATGATSASPPRCYRVGSFDVVMLQRRILGRKDRIGRRRKRPKTGNRIATCTLARPQVTVCVSRVRCGKRRSSPGMVKVRLRLWKRKLGGQPHVSSLRLCCKRMLPLVSRPVYSRRYHWHNNLQSPSKGMQSLCASDHVSGLIKRRT